MIKSIKFKILISFGIVGAIIIMALSFFISVKLSATITHQSKIFSNNLINITNKNLNSFHKIFATKIKSIGKDVERISEDISHYHNLSVMFENGQWAAVTGFLNTIRANTDKIDFAIFFDINGRYVASSPSDLGDNIDFQWLDNFYKSWDIGKRAQNLLLNHIDDEKQDLNAVTIHNYDFIKAFSLADKKSKAKDFLCFESAQIVRDDFGDPIAILITGKILNNFDKPLQEFYASTGLACVIYEGTVPIAHIGFNKKNESVAANLKISPEELKEIYKADGSKSILLTLAGQNYYTTCSAIKAANGKKIGALCVATPEKQIIKVEQQFLSYGMSSKKDLQTWIFVISIISLIVFVVVSLVLATKIVKPIKMLTSKVMDIANGDLKIRSNIKLRDEIGVLADALDTMAESFEDRVEIARAIALGDLSQEINLLSEKDELGKAFKIMVDNITQVVQQAKVIADGDYSSNIVPRSEKDELGNALQKMTNSLKEAAEKNERSNWFKTGQTKLADIMRGGKDLHALASDIIVFIAKYLEAQVGTFYVAAAFNDKDDNDDNDENNDKNDNDDKEENLYLSGSYALTKRENHVLKIKPGEGIVGQAFLEKQPIFLSDIPKDYIRIDSSLGYTSPKYIIAMPFGIGDTIKAVIELGSLKAFSDLKIEFLKIVSESIAITIHAAKESLKTEELLEKAQVQSEEFQMQQDQIKAYNEELQGQTHLLKSSEKELKQLHKELQAAKNEAKA